MKKHSKLILGLILCWGYITVAQSGIDIQQWKNSHTVPVYFVHTSELPMVDIQVVLRAGGIHDGENPGVAAITTDMLIRGSHNKDIEQINDALNNLGVNFNVAPGLDSIGLSLRSLSDTKTLKQSVDLFVEIISQPAFPEDELRHIKRKQLLHLRTQNEDLEQITNQTFREHVYSGHGYSQDLGGTEESISALTLDAVQQYYQKYFVRANMLIIAVGDISKTELNRISEQASGAFQPGMPAPAAPMVPALQSAKTVQVPFPSQQASVKIGQPFIEAGHPDYFALRLGNHILGGSGFGSRLMDQIRAEKGLAYSVYSHFTTRSQAGIFSIDFQTRIDQAEMAVDLVYQIVKDFVAQGPTEDEVELALSNIRGSFALNLGSNSAILGVVKKIAYHDLGLDYLDNYLQNFEKLDAAAIQQAFQKHLHPDKLVTVIVGNSP